MGRSMISRAPLAAALLAGALSLGGCVQTSTYGTGESPEMAIFREVSGGLGAKKKEPIEYQPRAPLVLPPSAGQLPPPVETAEAVNPLWPEAAKEVVDDRPADNAQAQRDLYQRTKPLAGLGRRDWDPGRDDGRISATERQRQRKEFAAALVGAGTYGSGGTGERRYLTEPPPSFRQPAATAPTEFEDIKKKGEGGFLTRLFGG